MYRKIGVYGATGVVGQEITRALVDAGFEVVPFSRTKRIVAGISTQELTSLIGFDVIVSTIGREGLEEQIPLIARAKADGVKRFIPSEFGSDHRAVKADFLQTKVKVFEAVKSAQFPHGYTCIANGILDCVIPIFVQINSATSKIVVQGAGTSSFPFTLRYDLGRVLAHTFRDPDQFRDKWISVVNSQSTLKNIAETANDQLGGHFEIQNVAITERAPVLKLLEVAKIPLFDTLDDHAHCPIRLTDMGKTMRWSIADDGKIAVKYDTYRVL